MRILFCDDDQEALQVASLMLEPRGHVVETTDRSSRAIELFESRIANGEEFDLIVSDVSMPGDSGYYFAGWVRAKGYDGRLAIMTATEAEIANLAAVRAEYWSKPAAIEKLIDLVEGGPQTRLWHLTGADECMSAKKLKPEHKYFIVQGLARYESPSAMAEAVREEFGIEIRRQSIESYDPTKRAGRDLDSDLKALFKETREKYLTDITDIGIAQQAFRLNRLHDMAMGALHRKNWKMAAQLMEQAAKEVGGMFTNRREHTGKDGKPIEVTSSAMEQAANELTEWRQQMVQQIGEQSNTQKPSPT